MALSDEEVVSLIRRMMQQIDDVRLLFELRKLNLRIKSRTLEYIKACIAISSLQLPITADLVATTIGSTQRTTMLVLHGLGDKGLLRFIPVRRKFYCWRPSQQLVDIMEVCLREGNNVHT